MRKILLGIFGLICILSVFLAIFIAYRSSRPPLLVNATVTFSNKVTIPPLLEPTIVDKELQFDLRVQEDKETNTYGYNGSILGPTLRAHVGDNIRIRVTNELAEETTVHSGETAETYSSVLDVFEP